MQPQNQVLYQQFQQTINEMTQRRSTLESDIVTVQAQLDSMKKELENLAQSILLHQGGMSTIEVFTNSGIALVTYEGDVPLSINPYAATTQMAQAAGIPQAAPPPPQPQAAPTQQQYAQQPTQQAFTPAPPITAQAQQTFAPSQVPSPGDIHAVQAVQGPQMVQGPPPTSTE